jgi:hypothetical protein
MSDRDSEDEGEAGRTVLHEGIRALLGAEPALTGDEAAKRVADCLPNWRGNLY